jgi:hypothetical protein
MSPPEPAPHAPKPARRCNADYRWTARKVEAFLRALGRCGKVAEAARAVGMSRQAAFRLKARLADPRFQHAFELARRTGRQAREAERAEARRTESQWGAPGLGAYAHLQGDGSRPQGDGSRAQGVASGPQGVVRCAQGDGRPPQGYASPLPGPESASQGDGLRLQGDGSGRKAPF